MSVWIAGATVAVGAGTAYMSKKAGDKAAAAQDRATASGEALSQEQLDFEYEKYDEQLARYDEWRAIYGPIEENLADFYSSLSPETFAAAGLEYNQQEFQKAKTQTAETLAQRGLDTSGITAAVEQQSNITNAQERAKIRRDAPFKVAEEQTKFHAAGRGGPVYEPAGTGVSNVMGARTNLVTGALQNEANLYGQQASSLWGSAGSLLSTGLQYGAQNMAPRANQGAPLPAPGGVDVGFNPTPADINLGV